MKRTLAAEERFSPDRMTKVDLFQSEQLMLGLNCLQAGQSQRTHAHEQQDKFYLVVRGRARFSVDDAPIEAVAGEIVLCPAGVPHGIERAHEETTLLIGIAPWRPR